MLHEEVSFQVEAYRCLLKRPRNLDAVEQSCSKGRKAYLSFQITPQSKVNKQTLRLGWPKVWPSKRCSFYSMKCPSYVNQCCTVAAISNDAIIETSVHWKWLFQMSYFRLEPCPLSKWTFQKDILELLITNVYDVFWLSELWMAGYFVVPCQGPKRRASAGGLCLVGSGIKQVSFCWTRGFSLSSNNTIG